MSAVNPLASSESASERKTYEPSMEEILASIRRIIADDQSLPGRALSRDLETQPAPRAVPEPEAIPLPVEPPPVPDTLEHAPEPQASEPAPAPTAIHAHGHISAPQFPSPEAIAVEPTRPEPSRPEPAIVHSVPPAPAEPVAVQPEAEPDFDPRHAEPAEPVFEAEPEAFADPDDEGSIDMPPEDASYQPAAMAERSPLFSAATDTSVTSAFNMLAASRLADNSDELMTLAREMIRPLLRSWIDDNLPSMVERMVRAEIERVARGGR